MPGGLFFADGTLPKVMEGQSTEEKVDMILSFLYELSDQLRYLFEWIDVDQLTTEALTELIQEQIKAVDR